MALVLAAHLLSVGAVSTPVDGAASAASRALLDQLHTIASSPAFVFGHHNSNEEGQHFVDLDGTANRSDVATATGGVWPGMIGYNLAWVAEQEPKGKNLTAVVAAALSATGGHAMLHLYWESSNPVTGGPPSDSSGSPITAILPGGSANAEWVARMDRVAAFLGSLHALGAAAVFRPFHENTGGWFWWGLGGASPVQYRAAWNYTADYLLAAGAHNVLFAYSPAKPASTGAWDLAFGEGAASAYPGDSRVDIACFDHYGEGDFHEALLQDCDAVSAFAQAHRKVAAICEFGVHKGLPTLEGSHPDWFTAAFLVPVLASLACQRIAFAYTWANSKNSYWVPLANQSAHASFLSFVESNATIFAGDLRL